LGSTDWKDVENTFSFGGLRKGLMVPPQQNPGTAFKIKNWSVRDWFGYGDDWDYGRALLGEESIYFKLEPSEDSRIFAFDDTPHGNKFVDASYHRHWITLINTNIYTNPYSSYWLQGAYFFENPDTFLPTTPTQSLSSSFDLSYNVPYVLSFWFKSHDVDPLGPRNFRILTFGVLNPAEAQKIEDRVNTPTRDKGPVLNFNLDFAGGVYKGQFQYTSPQGTPSSQDLAMIKNTWHHFTAEYYRPFGSSTAYLRFLIDGNQPNPQIPLNFGLLDGKNFVIPRKFDLKIGQEVDISASESKSYGHIRNVTLFTHTAVLRNCP